MFRYKKLFTAIRYGDIDTIFDLIQKRIDLSKQHKGTTPLIEAISHGGNPEIIRTLIQSGADYACDKDGSAPLYHAAWHGNVEVAKTLMKNFHVDVNAKNSFDMTALMAAASIGSTNMVKLLIERGADVNIKSIDGRTALMKAAEKGHVNVVQALLEAGANASLLDGKGQSAVTLAKDERIISMLLAHQEKQTGPTALTMTKDGNVRAMLLDHLRRQGSDSTQKLANNLDSDSIRTRLADYGASNEVGMR